MVDAGDERGMSVAFRWDRTEISVEGRKTLAMAPVIVSASRATDIPAFFFDWFLDRLRIGHVSKRNPFNGVVQHVSFAKTRAIVFWTKNAGPMVGRLPEIDATGINYYFQFTVNDYEAEGCEPCLPPLEQRIATFKALSDSIGRERVIWRFDPLMITDKVSVDELVKRAIRIGDLLHAHTKKLVFSFVDLAVYDRVGRNFGKANIQAREFSEDEMKRFAGQIAAYCEKNWGIDLATCAETVDLSGFGIVHNECIDDALLRRCFPNDKELMSLLGGDQPATGLKSLKDKGQRKACGCIYSKDIGEYGTCRHKCVYCYACKVIGPSGVDAKSVPLV